jgi:hypothetical protein
LLRLNVDFEPMVIGADTETSAQKSGLRETPRRRKAARRLERKSTGNINRAFFIKKMACYENRPFDYLDFD